jgi:hypothetical protein
VICEAAAELDILQVHEQALVKEAYMLQRLPANGHEGAADRFREQRSGLLMQRPTPESVHQAPYSDSLHYEAPAIGKWSRGLRIWSSILL